MFVQYPGLLSNRLNQYLGHDLGARLYYELSRMVRDGQPLDAVDETQKLSALIGKKQHPCLDVLFSILAGSETVLLRKNDVLHATSLLMSLVDEDLLESVGVIAPRRIPKFDIYDLPSRRSVFALTGSHLYGMASPLHSDYDIAMVVDNNLIPPTIATLGSLGVFVRAFSLERFAKALMDGKRHAWEIVAAHTAKNSFLCGDMIDDVLQIAEEAKTGTDPMTFINASCAYWREWLPRLIPGAFIDDPDPNVKTWVAQHGWAYKIAYFLTIDILLSVDAQSHGDFNPGRALAKDQVFVETLHNGLTSFNAWIDAIYHMASPRHRKIIESTFET